MPQISFEHIEKRYVSRTGRDYVAVRDFSLELASGEFFCLLGPSGCGKTTVLSMLAGFQMPSSGTIKVDGVPISGPSHERGIVFQGDDSLYPWLTTQQNVEFGLRVQGVPKAERRRRSLETLALVSLANHHDKYPTELSGGMKQRVQIGRALAAAPKILLMDEPFGALDAQTRSVMQRELRRIWRVSGTTAVFITHDLDEAITLGTRVGVMTAGPGGTLKDVVDIALAEPRSRLDPLYTACYARIESAIREEVERSAPEALSA